VQHEGESLRRRERVEHDEQREADRVGQHRLVLRLGPALGVRPVQLQRLLAARAPATQHVQAHPADDRGQPAAEVVHAGGPGVLQAQPCFLDGVVRLGCGAEHPVRDRPQVGAVALELLGQHQLRS
jgi:hypothetical protein